jgi:pimeloyl-ACP methyl ester carboxylesterase
MNRHAPYLWVVWAGFCLMLPQCMGLDDFLFAPTLAAAGDDLFAHATNVPKPLRQELTNEIITSDGVPISAWALVHDSNTALDPTPAARHGIGILYCHGNNQNLRRFALRAQALWELGYTVLAFDYRGYGKTPGTPSEQGTYKDGRAARQYLTSPQGLNIAADKVALYGYSLGAAICSQLAVESPTRALVLEAPFASIGQLIGDDVSLNVSQNGFTDAVYDTRAKISRFQGDLLIMHGDNDRYLMPSYGQQVAQAATHAAHVTFIPVPLADHETVPCLIKNKRSSVAGGCLGGIDPHYTSWVSTLIDGALAPASAAP